MESGERLAGDRFRVLGWSEFLVRTGMTEVEFRTHLGADERELASGLPRSEQHYHRGETVFVGLDGGGPGGEAGFPWELWAAADGQAGNGEMAALSLRNGLHFFDRLDLVPALEDDLATRPPRLLMVVGAREAAQELFEESFLRLEKARTRFRGWEVVGAVANLNLATVTASIAGGVDAVVFISHGTAHESDGPMLRIGGDERADVPWAALDEAFAQNPRPLRFAFIMACKLYEPVVATFRSLAANQRLHPHFGAVVVRGAPELMGGAVFADALLETLVLLGEHEIARTGEDRALSDVAPLAFAVQVARRRVRDLLAHEDTSRSRDASRVEVARARLVHGRPDVQPFPVGLELERERYLAALAGGLRGAANGA